MRTTPLRHLSLLPFFLSISCASGEEIDPCADVVCSQHGLCASTGSTGACICDPGYHASGLTCLPIDPACEGVVCEDPLETCINGACTLACDCSPGQSCIDNDCVASSCAGIDCGVHGACVQSYQQGAHCECDAGFAPTQDGLGCVSADCDGTTCEAWQQCVGGVCRPEPGRCDNASDCNPFEECDLSTQTCTALPDPCEGVKCSGHGVCSRDEVNAAVCNCEHGYMSEGTECVTDSDPVSWCAVWYPTSFLAYTGDPDTPVYGRIYQPGMTEQSSSHANIHAQLGFTQKSIAYPVITTDLTWVDASFNLAGLGDFGNDHEYVGAIPATTAGQLNYVYRFSVNAGDSWTYCDTLGVINAASVVPGTATVSGENPNSPVLELVAPPSLGIDSYSFQVRYIPGQSGAPYDPAKSAFKLNGTPTAVSFDDSTGIFNVSATGVSQGKYAYLFRVKDTLDEAVTLFVPFWLQDGTFEWRDAFLYQIVTDRFVNGSTANDDPVGAPVEPAGDWQGGDFAGVVGKIEDGYFEALGVNALWISSPILNTDRHEPGKNANIGHDFAAYHAYWPIATGWTEDNPLPGISSPIEHHFGTAQELAQLVQKAHEHGIRVLVDFVPNHVHTDAPLYQAHSTDGNWWHLPYDDCSVNNGWDTRRFTCWFDPFLPDFNCSDAAVRDTITAHAVWLIQEFNLDGFRVDATKHVVPDIVVDLRSQIEEKVSTTGLHFYMVGETLTANDDWVKEIVGSDRLDGSVNDPLHYNIVDTFLSGTKSPTDFDAFLSHNDSVWTSYYQDALLVNFMGSHDTPRAITIANGDDVNAIWSSRPQTPTSEAPFKRLRMAQTFLFTYQSIPVLYMGDEFGMPGASDPDNRRMMAFGNALSSYQTATLEHARKLGKLREQHVALRRGDRPILLVDGEVYVYARKSGSDVVLVAFNTSESTKSRNVNVAALGLSGALTNALGGGTISVAGGHVALSLPALSSAVYVP